MSNLANYSPYNKSFKFILFQNQAYHEKNKITANPVVKTNLRYSNRRCMSSNWSRLLPDSQKRTELPEKQQESPEMNRSHNNMTNSMFKCNSSGFSSPIKLDKQKRIIHKNHSFQKFRNHKINQENLKLCSRLLHTSCQVVTNQKTKQSFHKHIKYRNIRQKYSEEGRKDIMPLGNTKLLCPTLNQFNHSGVGQKFVESDLSFYSMNSTPQSPVSPRKLIFRRDKIG